MKIDYYLIDPTGNMTVIVTSPVDPSLRRSTALELMKTEPAAEQVGFLDTDACSLNMAGGEFCGNASMSAAAVLAFEENYCGKVMLSVSGAGKPVAVEVLPCDGNFKGKVLMPLPREIRTVAFPEGDSFTELPTVFFEGISHIIAGPDMTPDRAEKNIARWCKMLGADGLGIMSVSDDMSSMTPLVYVPAAGTMFFESSCASGTAAVGAYYASLSNKPVKLDILQPGGKLTIEAEKSRLLLTGTVKIIKKAGINY